MEWAVIALFGVLFILGGASYGLFFLLTIYFPPKEEFSSLFQIVVLLFLFLWFSSVYLLYYSNIIRKRFGALMKAKNNNQVEVDNTKDNLFLISIWISVVSIFGIFTLAFINSDAFQIGVPELSSVVSYLFSVVIPIFALLLVLTLLYLKYKKAKNNTLKDFKKKIILFTMLSVLPSCIMIGLLVGKSMAYTMAIIFFFYVGVAMIGTLLFHEEEYTEKDKYSIRKRLYNSLYAIFLTLFLIFLFYFFGTYVQHIDVSTFEFATVFIIIGIILLFWDWVEYECLWPDDKKPSYRIKAKLKETINNFHKYIKHFKFKH